MPRAFHFKLSHMPLPAILPIVPFVRPVQGEVLIPGSKSLTNRAMMLAALCKGPVKLEGALFSEDTALMAEALRKLGFTVEEDSRRNEILVHGEGGNIPAQKAELFVGLAGTTARFLTALCAAAQSGIFMLDGTPKMRTRPMAGLIDALRELSIDIRCLEKEGYLPIEIHAHGISGGKITLDASESSQMLSAIMMVAPLANAPLEIALKQAVREPFVAMTAELMRQFGIKVERNAERTLVYPGKYDTPGSKEIYVIEPDATAASYFLTLPLLSRGSLNLKSLATPSLQGDIAYQDVLTQVGFSLTASNNGLLSTFKEGVARGVSINFEEFSDTFLTLAAITPILEGPTRIYGVEHTRRQETDRIAGAVKNLRTLGQEVVETEDSLTINPNLEALKTLARMGPIELETYGDHRFAMSFGILGTYDLFGDGKSWLSIRNPECCAKTFPHFFELLESLRP